jgi:PadR family transcriptional regulator PadR
MSSQDSPLGSFEEQVLLAVLRVRHTGEAAYGMAVRREIERVSGRDVAIGAVYATLDRLEAKGLATSERATVRERTCRIILAAQDAHRGAELRTRAQAKLAAFDDGARLDFALLGIGGRQHAGCVGDFAMCVELVARKNRKRGHGDGSETHRGGS